jgi:Ca2+-binding EF-hand superfamily protein
MLTFLLYLTVDQVELDAFFEQFKSLATSPPTDSSPGGITREVFEICLGPLGLEKNLISDRIFAFFDQDGDKVISFKELVCGMSILCKGSLDERISCKFPLSCKRFWQYV